MTKVITWILGILVIMLFITNFFQWQQNKALMQLRQTENQICSSIVNALRPSPQEQLAPKK